MNRLVKSIAGALLAAVSFTFSLAAQAQAYPQRPITLIVPWGAGGGTDATARIIASLMEKELKQPINVVNRTGGSGVVGHQAIASAPPDGYTIGLITVEITMMHWAGLTQIKHSRLHADRPRELGSGRGQRARRCAVQVGEGPARRGEGEPRQVQGVRDRARGHLAPRARRHAQGPGHRPGGRSLGAVARRRARPAGPRRRRHRVRDLLDPGGARAHRRGQGESPRDHGREPARAVPEPADPEEGAQQQLGNGGLARYRGVRRACRRTCRARSARR